MPVADQPQACCGNRPLRRNARRLAPTARRHRYNRAPARHAHRGTRRHHAHAYLSQLPLNTFKETPADAEIASHQLMLRAGFIRRLASGLYSWLPLGMRVLQQGPDDHSRGDGPLRRARGPHARRAAGRALAGVASLGRIRPGPAATARTGISAISAWPRRTRKSSPTSRATSSRATGSCRSTTIRSRPSFATRSARASASCGHASSS